MGCDTDFYHEARRLFRIGDRKNLKLHAVPCTPPADMIGILHGRYRCAFPPDIPSRRINRPLTGLGSPTRSISMLTIFSKPHKTGASCDGLNRRDFLTIGRPQLALASL